MTETQGRRTVVSVSRRYRAAVAGILFVLAGLYLIGWLVDQSYFWPFLVLMYSITGLVCWRGERLGFAFAILLAYLGILTDGLIILFNAVDFIIPYASLPVLLTFMLLQFPLGYAAVRGYKGRVRLPLLLILIGSLLASSSYIQNVTRGYLAAPVDISTPRITTLSEILNGTFQSALDKYGTNGTVVRVLNVTVIKLVGAFDGDWHVVVQDDEVLLFITEILPRDHARLGLPRIGQQINMIGVVYWDGAHTHEAWHGYTGWEIHPVLAWSAI